MSALPWSGAAPSWPQLAGWLATPALRTMTGRWRTVSGAGAQTGTFAFRAPEDWHRTWDDETPDSGLPAATPLRWARPGPLGHDGGRWTLVEPVTAEQHDGRLSWRAPVRNSFGETFALLVDDASGLCMSASDGSGSWSEEVLDLVLDPVLPDGMFDAAVEARRQEQAEQRLHELLHQRPVPAPRWFPWRRSAVSTAGWRSVASRRGGSVTRVRAGQPTPRLPWTPDDELTLVEHDGWTYVLSGVDPAAARAVVDEVVEGRPYGW